MCSYWRSHDDGDLEAVVRGYSRIHGAPPAAAAPPPPPPKKITDDHKNLHQKFNDFYEDVPNNNSNGSFSALSIDYGNNDSEMLFSSLSMDLQHVCNPFYKETLLRPTTSVLENKMMKIERSSPLQVALSNPRSSITVTEPSARSSRIKEAESPARVETGGKTQPPPPSASSSSSSSKRRKAQQKRIVCVPVTGGGANSGNSNRPSGGEGVPSDLWAWRKYGQKPIKGSPYPRGYYRCSSSKGCSARKQVERSRTDPNMLVITYTSDHNHPWPTHRNALAGSTRQTSSEKSNSINNEADNTSTMQGQNPRGESPPNNTIVEDHHHETTTTSSGSPIATPPAAHIPLTPDLNPSTTIISQQQTTSVSYFPEHYEDLFADLGELPDSLDVFTKNFTQQNHGHNNNNSNKATTTKIEDEETCNNVVDPFHLFNWSSPSTTSSSSSSYANYNTTFLQAKSSSM